jgi:hypothetical protein
MNYKITGGRKLSGSVTTNISKNAAVALLCASLLNKGTTTLKRMPRIEEVNRIIEVMKSIGVSIEWKADGDIVIKPPQTFDLKHIRQRGGGAHALDRDVRGAACARFPILRPARAGRLRSREAQLRRAHRRAWHASGSNSSATKRAHTYHIEVSEKHPAEIVMYEASDTGDRKRAHGRREDPR